MSKTKRTILLVLAVMLIGSVLVGTAIAYFTNTGSVTNNFVVGNNSIRIDEDFTPPSELHQGDNPFAKSVRVANTGNIPCYIRVFMAFSDSKVRDVSKLANEPLSSVTTWYSVDEYNKNLPEGWEFIPLEGESVLGGYYYYKEPVPAGQSTNYLFQSVNSVFANELDVQDFEIIISADSIQTTDINGQEHANYQAAWTEFLSRRDV